ncbi:hypothetical protein [Streptomyces sp. NPDC059786]|uniref:hypothetical protein n=1 Tax=Streptomyces sp. NPDC059786 TaxID=3346946 RepID=UPI00365B8BAE
MSVVTREQAAGLPGRLATCSYVPAPGPVDVYLKATAGYEALFAEISGDYFRRLETETGDTSAPTERTEYLHNKLETWKQAIDRFDTTVTDADFAAIRHLPEHDPRRVGYLTANTAMDTWLACRDKLLSAFLDWSLDLTGTVHVPEPPGPDPVVVADGHRVPDCVGWCDSDDICSTQIASVPMGEEGELCLEVAAYPGKKARASVFAFNVSSDEVHLRTDDPAALVKFADQLHQFAGRIEHAAHVLQQLHQREGE